MQTNFTPEQLKDPDITLAADILRKCVHCGFCLATCPTYLLDADERDSPRGRIYLMKDYFETGRGAAQVLTHLDRCLTCGACQTTCPSGVDYLRLADLGRARLEQDGTRPGRQRLARKALAAFMTSNWLFKIALILGRMTRPFHMALPARLKGATVLLPVTARSKSKPVPNSNPEFDLAERLSPRPRALRILLHTGCVQKSAMPNINEATHRVLTHFGAQVHVLKGFGCCGAMADHLGDKARARKEAARNIKAILAHAGEGGFDIIVSNASGCGVALKDYGHLMRHDEKLARVAGVVASKTLDISQVLASFDLGAPHESLGVKVAWQAPCTLQHGQKINQTPAQLLRHFGYEVSEPEEAHLCCGSAGAWSLLEPERSARLRARKQKNLQGVNGDVIASANIGCILGLASKAGVPVLHMIELVDRALAGSLDQGSAGNNKANREPKKAAQHRDKDKL